MVTVSGSNAIDYEGSGGSYQIMVQATDGTLTTSQIPFNITVNNLAPGEVVDDDSAENLVDEEPEEDTEVGVTALSLDPGGGTVTYDIFYDDSDGGFKIDANTGVVSVDDGSKIVFDSSGGTYSVTVRATDSEVTSVETTFTITVRRVPPVFYTDLYYEVFEGESINASDFLANVKNAAAEDLMFNLDSQASHGTAGDTGYTAGTGYTGSDSFTYSFSNVYYDSETVTVHITIIDDDGDVDLIVNPVLRQTYKNEELVFSPGELMANAKSMVSSLSVVSVTGASDGTLTVDGNGNYHYIPDFGFTGTETISFTLTDGTNTLGSVLTVFVQESNTIGIDFSRLNNVAQAGWIRITLNGPGGSPSSTLRVNFDSGPNAGSLTAAAFLAHFEGQGWNIRPQGANQFTITSHGNQSTPIRRLTIWDYTVPGTTPNNRPELNNSGQAVWERLTTGGN